MPVFAFPILIGQFGLRPLTSAYQQAKGSAGLDQVSGDGQRGIVFLDRSKSNDAELPGKCFSACAQDSYAGEIEKPDDFAKKCCFLVVGLDQRYVDMRS